MMNSLDLALRGAIPKSQPRALSCRRFTFILTLTTILPMLDDETVRMNVFSQQLTVQQ